uniref:Uncharacterized protein n=1 Tax=Arundo donax TaxID=35708 RepID=A0A0A9ECT5_ARUDO
MHHRTIRFRAAAYTFLLYLLFKGETEGLTKVPNYM